MLPQQYCLRWKHHHSNVQSMFAQLLEKERFCDVTLYCCSDFSSQVPEKADLVEPRSIRGVSVRAHRVVLAACSELLGSLLGAHEAHGEPVLVIDGAEPVHVRALLDYMYTGEMSVHHTELPALLKTAEELRIKGLTDIRWNNKDEPPDCDTGAVTTTQATTTKKADIKTYTRASKPGGDSPALAEPQLRPERESHGLNGGPPPLIKIATKEKSSPPLKREGSHSDNESRSPKRQRTASQGSSDHSEDDEQTEQEWKHGNMDISAERVGMGTEGGSYRSDSESCSDWEHGPADIASFLSTRLHVDGDNSRDESSNDSEGASTSTPHCADASLIDLPLVKTEGAPPPSRPDLTLKPVKHTTKPTVGPKSGPTDPRFTDVIKLNDYLRHGRRPQFWEEDYVKRVMEAVRLKELEMKQAAEILGVSYGTLYGRYRDVYGCINRPYRNARDFWSAKGPSEVLDRLQRGEIPTDVAAQALGVSARDLVAHFTELQHPEREFEPIPIEIDPLLKLKSPPFPPIAASLAGVRKPPNEPTGPLVDTKPPTSSKWPTSIRLTNVESLRPTSSSSSEQTSPTLLMKTRPDLTIVAARKPDRKDGENGT